MQQFVADSDLIQHFGDGGRQSRRLPETG
jgi:hypothetical protein